MPEYREKQFETDIATSLIRDGGYLEGNPQAFDRTLALDTETFVSFIKSSQPKEWKRYEFVYREEASQKIVKRFNEEVHREGLLKVLRRGFSDRGIAFRVVYWKPETTMNATAMEQYSHNVMHCTRQVHHSPTNPRLSVDIMLFLNGIPVVSMELKNQFTGQSVLNALDQYRFDRSGKDPVFRFKERVLVHFAVDLSNVYMTTRLEGAATYFMPFNQGSEGAGNVGGKGNPINPDGYDTAYLWKSVLVKDRLLEIFQKYIHLEVKRDDRGNIKSERLIFPRYHQLDVVTKLLDDVRANGSGHNYLIQHSAGSGKSNSIAWLAHRLSGLHNAENEKIFHSVVIVTDRRVLDAQLQDTVFQFDHTPGAVCKVDKSSQQLKEAIENRIPIIITTLQKFPVIYRELHMSDRRFAVIVDEAHSSQTGSAAVSLKRALADTKKLLEEYAQWEGERENAPDDEDRLLDELAAHGTHRNMSFFAFTATPKEKTLNMFGVRGNDGKYRPYHIYSMRQAIEEGYILDVLRNYVTYKRYYSVVTKSKEVAESLKVEVSAGMKAISRYAELHPHEIAQKTSIILEHFMAITRHKIGGRAKAMLVTPSRLHAVRYLQEFRRQIAEKGYTNIGVLVAFSGEVTEPDDETIKYTEESLNRTKTQDGTTVPVRERELPSVFHTDDFGMLIVAEKYQTGFDEPLLHTMFVDKKLYGVKAVQTLSRLNRVCRGKSDTFILDFVNSEEDIKKSFEPYYESTWLEKEADPNLLYTLRNTLDKYAIYDYDDIEHYAELFYSNEDEEEKLGRYKACIDSAIRRYERHTPEEQALFRKTLGSFCRMYSFVTQLVRMWDKDLQKFCCYAKQLHMQLPYEGSQPFTADDKVLLEYYKLNKAFEGSIELKASEEGLKAPTGLGGNKERKEDTLEGIVKTFNEKYGTEFTEMDKVLMQIENDFASQDSWRAYAQKNSFDTFMLLFRQQFEDMAAARYDQNTEFFVKLFENPEMMKMVCDNLGGILYSRLQQHEQ